ncbi:MAG: D-tyrosyl-tRNA(Tyr) deacylase [Clostridia bacterium]|nr:D-tyrosyl-tRNA(Tyr) deacylase [Clostridia bacterium]
MRAVVQRVTRASVKVDGETVGEIGNGLLIFLGVGEGDTETDMKYIADKAIGLRIFSDSEDKMNLSVTDVGGSVLVISQFTLYGDCRKGRRPSFAASMEPQGANALYERFKEYIAESGIDVKSGEFGADMKVELLNDGPVTLLLDSSKII